LVDLASAFARMDERESTTTMTIALFPPSGFSASCFAGAFARAMTNAGARALAVDVPGRLGVRGDAPGSLVEFARACAREVDDALREDEEVFYFGHSSGAWMAYEAARAARRRPRKAYVSGARAPCLAHWSNDLDVENPQLSVIEDTEVFWEAFFKRYGINALLTNATRRTMLSSLRNDFRMSESYEPSGMSAGCAITAIGTRGDGRYDASQLAMWRNHAVEYAEQWFDAPSGVSPHRVAIEAPLEIAEFIARDMISSLPL